MNDKKELNEAVNFFDEFVNAALRKETDNFDALSVVKHYNILRGELAKQLLPTEQE